MKTLAFRDTSLVSSRSQNFNVTANAWGTVFEITLGTKKSDNGSGCNEQSGWGALVQRNGFANIGIASYNSKDDFLLIWFHSSA